MVKFMMTVGLPGSGKSTWSSNYIVNFPEVRIISSDQYRTDMFNDVSNQEHNGEVFDKMLKDTRNLLNSGMSVIYDATNISNKRRSGLLKQIKKFTNSLECHIFLATPEQLYKCNNIREKPVPTDVIKRMLKNFQVSVMAEGWDKIELHWFNNESRNFYDLEELVNKTKYFSQCNKHHSLDLFDHLMNAAKVAYDLSDNNKLMFDAAVLHDIGKLYTKTFRNHKGKIDSDAHYYGHEYVGGYLSFFTDAGFHSFDDDYLLHRSQLICYHMTPYNTPEETLNSKFGSKLAAELKIIHEADVRSH